VFPSADVDNLYKISQNSQEPARDRKPIPAQRLGMPSPDRINRQGTELVMKSLNADDAELLDQRSSRSICDAVGERLQQTLRPDSGISPYLQHLVDELRRRDEADGQKSH
jgi:hypothetical protein